MIWGAATDVWICSNTCTTAACHPSPGREDHKISDPEGSQVHLVESKAGNPLNVHMGVDHGGCGSLTQRLPKCAYAWCVTVYGAQNTHWKP